MADIHIPVPKGIEVLDTAIAPGEKMIVWNQARSAGSLLPQTTWHHTLLEALQSLNLEKEWKVRRPSMQAGDVMVVVGQPSDEGEACMELVAVGIITETLDDFNWAKDDQNKRFFGPSNEVETLSLQEVVNDQVFVAYPPWLPPEEYGVLDSLWRDYHPLFYPVTSPLNLAKWVVKVAAPAGKEPSKKGTPPKKGVILAQLQRNWIAYATTDAIADALLAKHRTPARILKILEGCHFTPKARNILVPPEFAGCGFGEKPGSARLQKFYDLHLKEMTLVASPPPP